MSVANSMPPQRMQAVARPAREGWGLHAEAVLATLQDGIVVLTTGGHFAFVNPMAEQILNRSAADLLGRQARELFPHLVGSVLDDAARAVAESRQPGELEYFSAAREKWYHVKIHPSAIGLTICFYDITQQKAQRVAQQVTEDRFRLATANQHLTLYEQDRDLRYTWLFPVHPEHSHALGRTDAELHPEGRAGDLIALKQEVMAAGREIRREIVAYLPSGPRFYDLFVAPRRNAAGEIEGVAGAALDITERKQFEQALRESEERLRTMFKRAPVGIAEADLSGRLVTVNPQFCALLGYEPAELLGRSVLEFTHPADVSVSRAEREELAAGKRSHYSLEKRYVRKDGAIIWVWLTVSLVRDAANRPKSCVGITLDISERKKAALEQQLLYRLVAAANKAANRVDVFEPALDALCETQRCERASLLLADDEGMMRFVAWRGLSAEYRRAVEGHSPWRPDEPDPRPVCCEDVSTGGLSAELQDVVRREGIAALAFIPLVADGRLVGKFMAYYDQPQRFDPIAIQAAETIARQVALAIARLRAAEALESLVASRTKSLQAALEQMEEFSYTVSHDLRAPIRSMRSFIEVIKEDHGAELSAEVRGHLDRVQRSAARMDSLVRDTLAYSRVARLECELAPIALDQVVQDVIAGLETNTSRHAIRVVSPLGTVMGQEMCLNQAISNLLHNALKFTKPGQAPDIDISATANEDHVTLFVRDRGIGIPAAAQPRLFRMFERLHSPGEYEGTGIGLAIVRKAVERMQGTVGMESDGQTGSTFWLRLRRG